MIIRAVQAKFGPKGLMIVGLIVLSVIVGGLGFGAVQLATQKLLNAEARIEAERWSSYFSANVRELQNIAGGATATRDARAVLDRTLVSGNLLSYRIYNAEGYLKLQSPGVAVPEQANRHVSELDADFAGAMKAGTPAAELRHGSSGEPHFLATALVPIKAGDRSPGWLLMTFDQTDRANLFLSITTQVSVLVGLLLIAAPIAGFYYHARNRALMEETLDQLSKRDRLTGFMLKNGLIERIEQRLAAVQPAGTQSALIFAELTGAPSIAHLYGQQAEEQVIHNAATRLSSIVAGRGEIATAGRGSFLIFVENVTDPMLILSLAKDITLGLGAESDFDGLKLACTCHTGIALSATDGQTGTLLLRNAELALLTAREQGTPGYGFYNPELTRNSDRRNAVLRAVTAATEKKSFRLDFQPVYNIRSAELNGFEALIRLHDDDLGNVSPAEFIPIAEQAGLINQIGAWALDEACRVAALWPAHLMVAVNLSPSQFLSGTLITDVRAALANNQFPSYRLEVEITEGTLMNDSELVLGQLKVLRDMGVAVALDDFGTGYSSLSYLWKFPFSKLKIDRSFVNALNESSSAKGILRSIVKLGHGLGLTVTAEGIETTKQYATLRELGCDLAQGFLLDRPARVSDIPGIILRNFANGLTRRKAEQAANKSAAA
jgi:predicted signal transduction protein with EAL and GGDEF domain